MLARLQLRKGLVQIFQLMCSDNYSEEIAEKLTQQILYCQKRLQIV